MGNKHCITSFKILENNDYNIILLETVKCNSKDELLQRERYWIESTTCVNKYIPSRTQNIGMIIKIENVNMMKTID